LQEEEKAQNVKQQQLVEMGFKFVVVLLMVLLMMRTEQQQQQQQAQELGFKCAPLITEVLGEALHPKEKKATRK
jgi:hypothetical protein